MPRLAGKVAIVTGGAKGIGRHYSLALAAEGARVMIADIEDGAALADEIAAAHGADAAASAVCDVSDEKRCRRWSTQTIKRFGQIDVLVNNAALYAKLSPRNFDEWDAATWDSVMAINMRGPWLMVRHVAPHMMARESGKIINIASGAAYKGVPRMLPYVTSKGAMIAFTRALSRELGQLRHRGQFAVARLYPERHRAGKHHPCRGGARARAQFARLQARRLSGGPDRHAGVPGLKRQRFHHRPVDRGGRRLGQ